MNERAGAPAWILIAAGVMNVLYSVIYGLWSLVPLSFSAMAMVNAVVDPNQHMGVGQAIVSFFLIGMVPMIQVLGFFVTFVMGCVTILGGIRLNQYRSKGMVWLGALSSFGAPVVCLLLNAASALNLGSLGLGCLTGCLLGNIPTLVTLLFGLIAMILAIVAVNGGAEQFERNAY